MKKLRDYQINGIKEVVNKFKNGKKRVIFQLATGGGKTITASHLIFEFINKNEKSEVVFFVHRIELLEQFRRTFLNQYGIEVGIINSKTKVKRIDLNVHVCMIETGFKRLQKNNNWFGNRVGLIVIDECHNSNFDKIFNYFSNTYTVGLTATPVRLSKDNLLKNIYNDIVTSVNISDLITAGSLSPNRTFAIKNDINYSKIKKKGGDFSINSISEEYIRGKHINNVLTAYNLRCFGKKTIIFNSSIEHSKAVNEVFLLNKINSKHLDGKMNMEERMRVLNWFNKTPNAVLNNVGVLTAGFDEPSIMCCIMNRPTTSLSLWLQCMGRGSRPYDGKDFFTIIDLGNNVRRLGDWSHDHDWSEIFFNEKLRKKNDGDGIPDIKDCPNCGVVCKKVAKICHACGHEFVNENKPIKENNEKIELELVVDRFSEKINVNKISNFVKKSGWNEYAGLHMIKDVLIKDLSMINTDINSDVGKQLFVKYLDAVKKWSEINNKNIDFCLKFAKKILLEKIK